MPAHVRYLVLLILVPFVATCTGRDGPLPPVAPSSDVVVASDPVVVAAGDLVCGTGTSTSAPCKHAETAAVTTSIAPAAVVLLGDIQYETATLSDFNAYYQPTWGVHKDITWPAPGNHEYQASSSAVGYFDYFNGIGVQSGRAGTRGQGYYSFNVGSWHVIALNSNCGSIGGCGTGSLQETWLRADLAANPTACTLAYWHHPRFSSGAHGNNSSMQALWQALYDHGADLVLAGHDHNYERFGPQTATGIADPSRGVRSFVVGTGGKEMRPIGTVKANSEFRNANSLGVLKLTLRASSYDWQFVPIPGHTLTDAGTAACVTTTPPPPPPPPPPQNTLTFAPTADAYTFKNSKNANFGSATTLLVDGSPEARVYFKFSVSGIGTKRVASAKLRLYAVDPSDFGGSLHRVTSTSWSEKGIKWSNQPSYTNPAVGSLGAVVAGAWYEIDVTAAITADGVYSFLVRSTSSDGADYVSREGAAANRPQLVIVTQ
jgi:hypothetical protein